MANLEGMEMKFTVLKNSELRSYVPGYLLDDLKLIANTVKQTRKKKGKKETLILLSIQMNHMEIKSLKF